MTQDVAASQQVPLTPATSPSRPDAQGLYDPSNEHDACGVGFVAHVKGKRTHALVEQGLKILENLSHRGATGYDPLLGDGAGILTRREFRYLHKIVKEAYARRS